MGLDAFLWKVGLAAGKGIFELLGWHGPCPAPAGGQRGGAGISLLVLELSSSSLLPRGEVFVGSRSFPGRGAAGGAPPRRQCGFCSALGC